MASRSGGKGSRAELAKTLKGLGIKNVTPAVIKAAERFTGSKEAISALQKPSGEETYYKNAVGRLKTDAQIEAEKTGAFDRTAQIASDLGISVPAVVSGYTSALGGLAGDLAAFGGGDARNALALDQTGASVAGMVTDLGTGASRMAASVKDLIAANADVYAATAKANRDTKREELLQGMRKAQDARNTALTAARVSAQSGILGNITTILGLRDSYGSGSGGYGGGSGGTGGMSFSWDNLTPAQENLVAQGQRMEGLMGSSPSTTPTDSTPTTTPAYSIAVRGPGDTADQVARIRGNSTTTTPPRRGRTPRNPNSGTVSIGGLWDYIAGGSKSSDAGKILN